MGKSLLVCFSLVAVAFADEEAAAAPAALPLPYWGGLGAYPYALPHAYAAPAAVTLPSPVQYQYVPKEVEIEVKTFQPELVETGCKTVSEPPFPASKPERPERGGTPRRPLLLFLPLPFLWLMLVSLAISVTLMPTMLPTLMLPMPSLLSKKLKCQHPSTSRLLRKCPFNPFAKTIWAWLFLVFNLKYKRSH